MPLQTQLDMSADSEIADTMLSSGSSIERRTIRKLQIRLLPLLFLLYVVAFVDRINIAFAALTMNKELAITSQQFGFAAGIFLPFSNSSQFPIGIAAGLAVGVRPDFGINAVQDPDDVELISLAT